MTPISLSSLRRDIAAGRLTPQDSIRAARLAIQAREDLRAFVRLAPEQSPGEGPLAGIAVGVKDVIDTADMPTEMGCPAIYEGWQPKADAPVVSRLRSLGATIIGKTATTAFAFMDPAPTFNPHDPGKTPGGSSAGSAAAVAAGLVPLALGTQTAGSVIRPASFCGVAGMKPSFRLLPTVGVKACAWTLDTVGLFAATVPDLAEALALISGRDMTGRAATPIRFGVVRQETIATAEPEAAAALSTAAEALRRAGFGVRDLSLPPELGLEADEAHQTVMNYEMREALAWEWRERRDGLPPRIAERLAEVQGLGAAEYDAARGRARRARLAVKQIFGPDGVDAVLTYAAPGPAPDRATTGSPVFNRLWTLLGLPCVSVPGLRSPRGLPIGIQVVGPFARDAATLAAAAAVERVIGPLL
jgi:Asp-tRNA(Asn)/Glu-tRNA(Gln) amidotransferase A subunit family amidase